MKTEPTDPAYTGLIEIRRAAEKGAELTQRLLAFSRRQTPRPEPLDLSALISPTSRCCCVLSGKTFIWSPAWNHHWTWSTPTPVNSSKCCSTWWSTPAMPCRTGAA